MSHSEIVPEWLTEEEAKKIIDVFNSLINNRVSDLRQSNVNEIWEEVLAWTICNACDGITTLEEALRKVRKYIIRKNYEKNNGDAEKTARELDISISKICGVLGIKK